jgi:hypothetical protein
MRGAVPPIPNTFCSRHVFTCHLRYVCLLVAVATHETTEFDSLQFLYRMVSAAERMRLLHIVSNFTFFASGLLWQYLQRNLLFSEPVLNSCLFLCEYPPYVFMAWCLIKHMMAR